MSVLSSIAEFWQNTTFTHGGESFTLIVFTAMATIAFSSKAVDFLLIKRNEAAERLRCRIKEELSKDMIVEEQNKQYTEAQKKVEGLIAEMDDKEACAIRRSRRWASCCMVAAFFAIATGKAACLGVWPLLAFLPMACERRLLVWRLGEVQKQLATEGETFGKLLDAYTAMANKLGTQSDSSVDKAIQKRKPGRPRKKQADTPPAC